MNRAVSIYFISALTMVSSAMTTVCAAAELNANGFSSSETNNTASSSLQGLLSDMKQFRAGFDQTVVDAQQNVVHEARGTLTMTRPNKLRWETTFPDETLLVADGEAVWNVDTFVEQVTILSQADAIKDNPIVLLTSSDEEIWSKFTISQLNSGASVTMVDDNVASKMKGDVVKKRYQITPKEAGGQIATLTLTFNQDNELALLTMLDAQQQISTLVFNNIETRFPVPAETFSVNVPDSFIIDDQR